MNDLEREIAKSIRRSKQALVWSTFSLIISLVALVASMV